MNINPGYLAGIYIVESDCSLVCAGKYLSNFLHFPSDRLFGEFGVMACHVRSGMAENKNKLEFFFEKELIIVHSSCFVITFLYVLVIAMYINMKIFIKFDDAFKSS